MLGIDVVLPVATPRIRSYLYMKLGHGIKRCRCAVQHGFAYSIVMRLHVWPHFATGGAVQHPFKLQPSSRYPDITPIQNPTRMPYPKSCTHTDGRRQ